jgi:hypothetical protein
MLERIKKLLDVLTPILILTWLLLIVVLPRAGEQQRAHFILFIARQSAFDIAVLSAVSLLAWFWVRQGMPRGAASAYPGSLPSVLIVFSVRVVLPLTLLIPLFFLLKARAFYWRDLPRQAYATHYRAVSGDLATRGQLDESYRVSALAYSTLRETPQNDLLFDWVQALGGRVKRSEELSGDVSQASMVNWNPMRDRRLFFELAEAIRVDPERRTAARALRRVADALPGLLENDTRATCGPTRDSRQLRTLTLLEWEIRQNAFHLPLSRQDEERCRSSIYGMWNLDQVHCLIERSESSSLSGLAQKDSEQPETSARRRCEAEDSNDE